MRRDQKSMELNKSIGERIKTVRLSNGLSRQRLAERVGVTHQQFQKYENGANRVSAARLQIIADVFGMPVGDFYDTTIPQVPDIRMRRTIEMIRHYAKLDEKRQVAILQLVKEL